MNRGRLGDLLATHIPQLRRYARALTHNPEAADELVQDSLERAWRKIDRWEVGSDLRAWLFTLMHNVHVNHLRRGRLELQPMPEQYLADPEAVEAEHTIRLRDLEAGLAQLPTDQKEVLLLVCLEDMTYEQVAGVLGIPIGTVMSRLHRARERLRHWMTNENLGKPPLKRVK